MKKLTYLFLISVACIGQSYAQDSPDFFQDVKTISFGPRAGLVTSILNIDVERLDNRIRVSYVVGAFARYQITKRFALQLDAVYAERGGSYKTEESTENPNFALGFFDPQLTAIYDFNTKLGKNTTLKWNLFGGFQPSFLLRAEAEDVDIKDNLQSVSFDFIVGSSLYIKRFILSATTKIGLTDLNDNLSFFDLDGNTLGTPKLGSLSTEWTVAYQLRGRKK